ncbi:MAG: LemA family protein [Planctomycetota bacterium]
MTAAAPWVLASLSPAEGAAIAGGAGLLLGLLFAWLVRRQDHRTWVLARAPQLPVRALASGDDAWVTGAVRCAAPLVCPWFDVPCVAYDYVREKLVTVTTTDGKGKTRTRTEWRRDGGDEGACDFELDDGDRIGVRIEGADNEALQSLPTDYETVHRRHRARVLELDAAISVLGVVQPDRVLAREREVPLLLTRRAPAERVRTSARGEAVLFAFAWLWPLVAGFVAVAVVHGRDWTTTPALLWGVLAGALSALPFWAVLTHNRLVRLRQQVRAAFRQVDVDLSVRAALVPNLVAVVRGAAGHERSLLEDLAALRTHGERDAAAAAAGRAAEASRQVLLLHERYPELRTDALYLDLHQRLWAVEEKLTHTRTLYNDVVREWNDRIARFPSLLVARLSRCRAAPPFAGDDAPLPPPLNARDD